MKTYLKQAENRPANRRDIEKTARDMLAEIGERGDQAVRDYALKLDGWKSQTFRVAPAAIRDVERRLPETFTPFQLL